MADALAKYILELSKAAAQTHFTDDRPLYQMYLADAAVLLALVVRGAERAQLKTAVESHERLWAQTWLQDEVFRIPADAFAAFREQLHWV